TSNRKWLLTCRIFVFQAEDGIRALYVTGVQTCALPISRLGMIGPRMRGSRFQAIKPRGELHGWVSISSMACVTNATATLPARRRSEERRVGKEGSARRGGRNCQKKDWRGTELDVAR